MTPSVTRDVVIVGGGVIGCAIASYLAELSDQRLSILIAERDPSYKTASSALSASSIRQQFSTPVCIAMSRYGVELLRDPQAHFPEGAELGFVERGYLYLAAPAGAAALKANAEVQLKAGVDLALLDRARLASAYPWLSIDDIALATFGRSGEGWFDGYSLLQAFRGKARALGVEIKTDEVVQAQTRAGRVVDISLAGGETIACGALVNAAGPYARGVARMVGFDLPVYPEKRSVFVFDCPTKLDGFPLIIDPSGLYVRPEGAYYIAGGPAVSAESKENFDLEVDYDQFDSFIWPTLAHRVPAFEQIKFKRGWAGHYEINAFDHNALIGQAGPENFFLANGFSGHGMQHAAAAGRGLAELMLYGAYRTLDLSPLSPARLACGAPLREENII